MSSTKENRKSDVAAAEVVQESKWATCTVGNPVMIQFQQIVNVREEFSTFRQDLFPYSIYIQVVMLMRGPFLSEAVLL